jgi:hypothetical protein
MKTHLGIYPIPYPNIHNINFSSNRDLLKYLSEIVDGVVGLRPRVRKNSRNEFEYYEYDRGIYVVDVNCVRGVVKYGRRGEEDLLVSNFWALLLGLLRDVNVSDIVDTAGGTRDLRTIGDVNVGSAYLVYGTSTVPETFTDSALKAYSGSISTSISISYLSDRTRVILSGVLPATAYELGIYQSLYTAAASVYTAMLARMVGSWVAGQSVSYCVDFLSPWVKQVGDLMFGIFRNADVYTQRIDGTTITLRTSTGVNAGTSYVVISSTRVSWSPSLYYIPDGVSITTYYTDILGTRVLRVSVFHGLIAPSVDTSVNTIGLYQPVYDSGGAIHTVCWLVLSLTSPITLYAGRNNLIIIRVLAM